MLSSSMSFQVFGWHDIINKFCELSGWESDENGWWNCKFDKDVTFHIEYYENSLFIHEQDYNYFYTDSKGDHNFDSEKVDLDRLKLQLKIYNPPTKVLAIDTIIQYLQEQGELPSGTNILMSNCI